MNDVCINNLKHIFTIEVERVISTNVIKVKNCYDHTCVIHYRKQNVVGTNNIVSLGRKL